MDANAETNSKPTGLSWRQIREREGIPIPKPESRRGRQRFNTPALIGEFFKNNHQAARNTAIACAAALGLTVIDYFVSPIPRIENFFSGNQPTIQTIEEKAPKGHVIYRQEMYGYNPLAIPTTTPTPSSEPEKRESIKEEKTSFAEFLFPKNYTPSMLEKIKKNAQKEAQNYFGSDKTAEEIIGSIDTNYGVLIKKVVQDPRLKIPVEDQENWAKLAAAIIAVESKGKNTEKSSAGALGLMQTKPMVLKTAAKKHQVPSYDPDNAWDNTFLGLQHLLDLKKRSFHSIELALAAYNLGEKQLSDLIYVYAKDLGANSQKLDDDFTNMGLDGINPTASWEYGKRYNIITQDLSESPAVKAYLAGHINPYEITNYFGRIVAALNYIDPQSHSQTFGDKFLN